MLITIYDSNRKKKADIGVNDSSTQVKEIHSDNVLSLSFTLYGRIELDVNDYVDFEGERYWLTEKYRPTQKSNQEWEYNVKLYGIESLIKRFLVLKNVDGENEPVFSLTAPARDHVAMIVECINLGMGTTDWKVGEVADTGNIIIDYEGTYCNEGLKKVAEASGTEWWFDGMTVNVCRCEHGEELALGYGNGILSIEPGTADNVKFYTRLFPTGSTRNIDPSRYGHSRLQLPGGIKYVDVNTDKYGIIHHYEQDAFSHIYPKRIGTISGVRSEKVTDEDGNPFTVYYFKDSGLDFDPNSYEIAGLVKQVTFQNGELNGREFEVNFNSETKEFEIITIWPYDDGTQLPGGLLVPESGDEYILWNIRMPDEYYPIAETEYLTAVNEYNAAHGVDVSVYKCPTDHVWVEDNGAEFYLGRRVRLESSQYFPETGYRSSRITKITRRVNLPSYVELEISDAVSKGGMENIEDSIDEVRSIVQTSNASIPDIIRSWERTPASDYNLFSALKTLKMFLRKDQDDRTPFKLNVGDKLTAERGIQIGESFVPGILTGSGGFFDEWGNGEVESLIVRRFLEVPDLRYNRVQVTLGDKWNAPGAGVVERVVPDSDTTGTVFLKLEDGEYGAIAVGDICMGIFHSMTASENATEDSDDSRGNFQYAGFYTCYFTITEITGKDNKQFRYQMRPVNDRWKLTIHPRQAMTFVCYGSFTDPSRQTSSYTTRTYYRLLKFQNTWEISEVNIAMQLGDLTNLSVHGLEMSGYSAYLKNIYMTGIIRQFNESGVELKIANDRGAWLPGTAYAFYDRVSHDGCLWLCVNESGTNTEPSKTDPSWLKQVDSGSGIISSSHWNSNNVPYKANTILNFADKVWISNKMTSEPPFPIYTDNNGNRLTYNDGGYILVSPLIQSEDWDLLLDVPDLTNGADGADGASLYVRYSADGTNWHDTFTEGDIYMQQRVGLENMWSDPIRIVGEDGLAKDGRYADYQFAVNDSDTVAPVSSWQDAPPPVESGQYLWMRMRIVDPNEDTPGAWSIPVRLKGDKGDKGDGITPVGAWKSGMIVPALGVVTMGGVSFVAKVATTNPPLWCYTDSEGNYLKFTDGGYILTGECNMEEYDELVHSGKDGKDGTEHEYIYIHTNSEAAPATPNSIQQDDYIPGGWHDDPLGVSESLLYEWVSVRKKENGIWGSYSKPSLWAKYGEDGSNYEFVYIRTTADEAPAPPASIQQDDYVPDGWTDDPVGPSQEYPYEWMSRRKKTGSKWGAYSKPTHWTYWAKDGEGFEMMGNWHSGLVVPKLGVISMGGRIWVAKVATTNPPLWCYTDSEGNYLKFTDGGYILTGECNTEEYDLWVSDGIGSFMSTVFIRTNSTPATPSGGSYDNPVPTGWSDGIPSGTAVLWASTCVFRSDGTHDGWSRPAQMTDTANFDVEFSSLENPSAPTGHPNTNSQWSNTADENTVWMATSTCSNGTWSSWSVLKIKGEKGAKGDTGDKGDTGIQGCIYRHTEWVSGTKYHNDTGLTSGIRYIDIVTVTDSSGNFSAYECKSTHTAGESNKPGSGESWQTCWTEMNSMQPIYTPLLFTKNAVMRFGQANQLIVLNDGGDVMAGLSGGSSTNNILLWVGGTPANAPFTVDKDGNMVASKATISGTIIAEAGSIGGFNIGENYIGSKDLAVWNNALIRISPDRITLVHTRYEVIDFITYEGQSETVLSPGRLITTNTGNAINSLALRARSGNYMLEVTGSGIRISKDGGVSWTYLKYE